MDVMAIFNLPIVQAVLLLIAAFIVAAIAKALVMKLISSTKLSDVLTKADESTGGESTNMVDYIGKLVYLLVFLLFVPGIFSALGVESVATPILGLLNTIWGYVPNILAAGIILVVGFMVARLVRQLLIPVFSKLRVDEIQTKAGIQVDDSAKLSVTLAYVVYVIIVIPIIIIALQVLNISAISDPAISMLNQVFAFIPNIVVAALIVGVGVFIARLASQIVGQLLATTGIDAKATELMGGKLQNVTLSRVIAVIVQALIIIFFAVEGLSILKLDVLTNIGNSVIGYLPNALAAVIIIGLAVFASTVASNALKKTGFAAYAPMAQAAILVIGAFMVLNQLHIASTIVNTAFIVILAAVGVAAAIAFGLGGKDFAAKRLEKWDEQITKKD
ncbi:MAG: mechanosensitive ion channel [Atopobiaceae bacterium]|nr:mechanosensitive ion channel [Atopobiaceae bacterium]